MSIIEQGMGLDGAVTRDLVADAALRSAREPGFAERFEHAARLPWRGRVAFRMAVAIAGRKQLEPAWGGDELLAEMGRRTALAATGRRL